MRDQLYDRFSRLSASFVPQWRFEGGSGDLGSGLAELFLWMQEDSRRRFLELPEYFKACFFQCFEMEPRGLEPSEGYITCDLVKETMPEECLKAGTVAVAQRENGERVRFAFLEDLYVTKAAVEQVKYCEGSWYIKLTSKPEDGILHLLVLPVTGGGEKYRLVLEYFGEKGFKSVPMADGTQGLLHSGIIKFAGRQEYACFSGFGEEGIFLRLRDSEGRPLPKAPAAMYFNGVGVRSIEGGVKTAIPAQSVLKLEETRGFVSRLNNPDPLSGGSDAETKEEMGRRMANGFLHRNRAVAPGDFEKLAREACPGILNIRCFAGFDESGNKNPGHVTLAVLIEKGPEGSRLFFQAAQQIYGFLEGRMTAGLAAGGRLHITAPLFVRIDVTARIEVRRLEDYMKVRAEGEAALKRYLSPWEGWNIGDLPGIWGIRNVLGSQPGVVCVRRLFLNCFVSQNGEAVEVELEEIRRFPWVMPECGALEILLDTGG